MGRKRLKPRKATQFSETIRELRKKNKLTLDKASQALDLSASYLSRIEAGDRQPSRDVVLAIGHLYYSSDNQKSIDQLLISAGFTPLNINTISQKKDIEAIYEDLLAKNPNDFKVYTSYVFLLIKTGRYEAAKTKIHQGFQSFSKGLELKTLLAGLALLEHNYKEALKIQKSAIDDYIQEQQDLTEDKAAELFLNLGIILFMQGYTYIDEAFDAERNQNVQQFEKLKKKALKILKQAKKELFKALEITPEDIYILDEIARVQFNIAYLISRSKASKHWQEAIECFEKVTYSDQKFQLGHHDLLEACIFLALAFIKNKQYSEAECALNMLELNSPKFWLLPYVKASLYCRKYETTLSIDLLKRALKNLQLAMEYSAQMTRSEAKYDPDFNVLKLHRTKEFNEILQIRMVNE